MKKEYYFLEKLFKFRRFLMLFLVLAFIGIPSTSFAITYFVENEALRKILPKNVEIIRENKILTETQVEKLKERLGGKLVNYTKGEKAKTISNKKDYEFILAKKDGKIIGAAIILDEPGRWGPIKYMIAMDMDARSTGLLVMSYTEIRGRPIARKSFLAQFVNKISSDQLRLNKEIIPVSGATISSGATAFIVKKALYLFEEFYK